MADEATTTKRRARSGTAGAVLVRGADGVITVYQTGIPNGRGGAMKWLRENAKDLVAKYPEGTGFIPAVLGEAKTIKVTQPREARTRLV